MPTVRLSGTVRGENDPNRESRARLLYLLFSGGWNIYNANGDQQINLSNIEEKIVESASFVFMEGANLEDLFKAVSIFVGYQTVDPNLAGKPTVILNSDRSWDPFFELLGHLRGLGTIKQDYRDFLLLAENPGEVLGLLEEVRSKGLPSAGRSVLDSEKGQEHHSYDGDLPTGLDGNICVFCSASIEDEAYLADGRALGRMIAENNFGCVSGAGCSGVMGAVVDGAVAAGGWTGGSNVPHIIELEGLPEGITSFWLRPDIYTRMEVMIEHSDAFVAFPGGSGTVQEVLALLIFKQQQHPLMNGKPIVLFNRRTINGDRFWDPFLALLADHCVPGMFTVVDELVDIVPTVAGLMREERCGVE